MQRTWQFTLDTQHRQSLYCAMLIAILIAHYKVWAVHEALLDQPQQEEVTLKLHSLSPFEQNGFNLADVPHLSDQ